MHNGPDCMLMRLTRDNQATHAASCYGMPMDSQRNAMPTGVFGNWAHRFTSTTSVFKRYIFWFWRVFFAGMMIIVSPRLQVVVVKRKTFRRFHRANVFYMIAMTLENTDKCSNVIAALAKCKSVNKTLTMRCQPRTFLVQ